VYRTWPLGSFSNWITGPVKPALQRLHWLPVKARIEFKIAISSSCTPFINNAGRHNYLSNMVQFNTAEPGCRQLRSSTTNAAFVVLTRTQFGKRAFSVCSPSISNQIPPHIRNLHSAPAFRKALKTYLFLQLSTLYALTVFIDVDYYNIHDYNYDHD